MCVYPSHFNVMSGSSQITFTCDTIHRTFSFHKFPGLYNDLDRNWKLCVSVRPISRSCQDHQKSPLVCLTFTQFAKHFDYLPKLPVLCDDIDKNLKICVYPSHFNVMSSSSQITFTLCYHDTIHRTFSLSLQIISTL